MYVGKHSIILIIVVVGTYPNLIGTWFILEWFSLKTYVKISLKHRVGISPWFHYVKNKITLLILKLYSIRMDHPFNWGINFRAAGLFCSSLPRFISLLWAAVGFVRSRGKLVWRPSLFKAGSRLSKTLRGAFFGSKVECFRLKYAGKSCNKLKLWSDVHTSLQSNYFPMLFQVELKVVCGACSFQLVFLIGVI